MATSVYIHNKSSVRWVIRRMTRFTFTLWCKNIKHESLLFNKRASNAAFKHVSPPASALRLKRIDTSHIKPSDSYKQTLRNHGTPVWITQQTEQTLSSLVPVHSLHDVPLLLTVKSLRGFVRSFTNSHRSVIIHSSAKDAGTCRFWKTCSVLFFWTSLHDHNINLLDIFVHSGPFVKDFLNQDLPVFYITNRLFYLHSYKWFYIWILTTTTTTTT